MKRKSPGETAERKERAPKKRDTKNHGGNSSGNEGGVRSGEEKQYVSLGDKTRATVNVFNGRLMVDIRKFYDADGEEKPGKKGISLNIQQWEALLRNADAITLLLDAQKKSKGIV